MEFISQTSTPVYLHVLKKNSDLYNKLLSFLFKG